MAAGQQKKRLNAYSAVGYNLQKCSAKKKKNVESSHSLSDMSSHVSLEWDDKQKRIVAKGDQIGITWSELSPFMESFSKPCVGLADVVAIPQETFEIEDMTAVLSYEAWKMHLSESERNFLSKFLPKGTDSEEVVQGLLSGENLNFGNPFLKWGASLCSGNFHPDVVLSQELSIKANKKAYYQGLQKYHNGVVENLQKLKQLWRSCKDPEKDFPDQILCYLKKHVENSLSSHANEGRPSYLMENLAATAESFPSSAIEKICCSSKQSTLTKEAVLHDRKGLMNRCGNSSAVSKRPKVRTISRKEENLQKVCVRSGDADKYMSYFKISKKQHVLVKSIKQSGDGIQSKSLNLVLGDIKSFHVQPYEAFEAEERKKLHEHWLQMTNKDLPVAFAHWIERKSQRQQWRMSLDQEIAEKKKDLDEEKVQSDSLLEESRDNRETYHDVTKDTEESGDEEESAPRSTESKPLQRVPSLNGPYELNHMVRNSEKGNQHIPKPKVSSPTLPLERGGPTNYAKESGTFLKNNQTLQRIPLLNSHQEPDHMDTEMEEANQDVIRPGASPNLSEVLGNMNSTENSVDRGVSISSAKEIWPATSMLESYHHRPMSISHGYTSAELSLRLPNPIRQHPAQLIDLEADTFKNNVEKPFFQRKPSNDVGSALHINRGGSDLGSYRNRKSNDIQPFLQGQGVLPSYPHERKQIGIQFLETRNGSFEIGSNHPGHFRDQQRHTLDQRQQISDREVYMHQVKKKIYSGSGRYHNRNPCEGLISQVEAQNWVVSPVRVSAPLQSPSNGERLLSGKNWFSGEHGILGGWSEVGVSGISGQCMGNRGDTNESLYGVVSQHNKSHSRSYHPVMTEQYLPMRDFAAGRICGNSDFPSQTGHQLNHLSGHEAASTATITPASNQNANSTSWMNLTHQSSCMHDSLQKPFLSFWS